ncbi:cytochrome P450 3A31-like [Ixodes scapularis]|uniref:cytochrome P450 3A31-like n=1 Tax=Ixodes scapularis TaxID=6945 RepID=UPI001A9D1359|nr:cytochrome P450 3A31-like [Ixodes scapularis]
MDVLIPVYQLHYDAELWDDPWKFDPERFGVDKGRAFNPMAFQAFGNGPRNCIGKRFTQQQLKLAFAKILAKYKIVPDDRYLEEDHLQMASSYVFCKPRGGVWLKFQKIYSNNSEK